MRVTQIIMMTIKKEEVWGGRGEERRETKVRKVVVSPAQILSLSNLGPQFPLHKKWVVAFICCSDSFWVSYSETCRMSVKG